MSYLHIFVDGLHFCVTAIVCSEVSNDEDLQSLHCIFFFGFLYDINAQFIGRISKNRGENN